MKNGDNDGINMMGLLWYLNEMIRVSVSSGVRFVLRVRCLGVDVRFVVGVFIFLFFYRSASLRRVSVGVVLDFVYNGYLKNFIC